MFAVCVTFTLKPNSKDRFLPLIYENAAQSRLKERGCHQFDVATDPSRENDVFLYEIYSDSFAHHLRTAHYRLFDTATVDLVAGKHVKTYSRVIQ
ncbi:MAG: putative quinol monooxygenase [Roseobacter sp.]